MKNPHYYVFLLALAACNDLAGEQDTGASSSPEANGSLACDAEQATFLAAVGSAASVACVSDTDCSLFYGSCSVPGASTCARAFAVGAGGLDSLLAPDAALASCRAKAGESCGSCDLALPHPACLSGQCRLRDTTATAPSLTSSCETEAAGLQQAIAVPGHTACSGDKDCTTWYGSCQLEGASNCSAAYPVATAAVASITQSDQALAQCRKEAGTPCGTCDQAFPDAVCTSGVCSFPASSP
jgi:hypothetical protein